MVVVCRAIFADNDTGNHFTCVLIVYSFKNKKTGYQGVGKEILFTLKFRPAILLLLQLSCVDCGTNYKSIKIWNLTHPYMYVSHIPAIAMPLSSIVSLKINDKWSLDKGKIWRRWRQVMFQYRETWIAFVHMYLHTVPYGTPTVPIFLDAFFGRTDAIAMFVSLNMNEWTNERMNIFGQGKISCRPRIFTTNMFLQPIYYCYNQSWGSNGKYCSGVGELGLHSYANLCQYIRIEFFKHGDFSRPP